MNRKTSDSETAEDRQIKTKRLPSAKSKVLSLLARREHSQQELKTKLVQRGYTEEEAGDAIRWALSHQFQSDERFAVSLVRRRASTFGDRAIEAELSRHGLPAKKLEALDGNDSGSETDRAAAWIRRRKMSALNSLFSTNGMADPNDLFKLKSSVFRALGSRGFEFSHIDHAWRLILDEFNSNA
jgi:regulatory protein